MTNEIQQFVKEGLTHRISRETMRTALTEAGWEHDEIETALSSYADSALPIAVPKRRPYLSAREAFLYLVLFLTLYITSFSFGTLIFQAINHWLPDPIVGTYYSVETVRSATSALIITFPVFLFVTSLLAKAMAKHAEKRSSKIRKWLTYMTLFVAAGIVIGDLIALVNTFLSGELTLRFVLKVVTIIVIAGTIFGYYLWDLKREEKEA